MKALSFLFLASLLVLTSCDKDDDIQTPEPQTIADIAASDAQFSTLVEALQRTNLVSVLDGAGQFTVFAPTNAAFQQLGVDLSTLSDEALANILLYHVLAAPVSSGDIQEGQTYVTTAATASPGENALSMLVEKGSSGVELNGQVNVTTADVTASNGIIHIVDAVLTPLDVVGHAVANENFSELVAALSAASGDLVTVLSGTGPFTVFAPLNSGFEAISDVVATLSPDQLSTVLTYHVVGGSNVRSTDLSNAMQVMTVSGQEFTVDLSNGVKIIDQGGAESGVILTDVQATNGVIHVLENVIIPTL